MSRRPVAVAAVATAAAIAGCGSDDSAPPRPAIFRVAVGGGLRPDEVATAFALGSGRVATVAHVLGTRRPGAKVRLQGTDPRRSRSARILQVDERDDLALLTVPGLSAPRARIGAAASAAAMVLVVRDDRVRALPARLRRRIFARIRTPDGKQVVRRPALELRADIAPGDSGAPVITADGHVVGVIFADSNLREHVAYAVDAGAVARL